jgi:hypothetical protein
VTSLSIARRAGRSGAIAAMPCLVIQRMFWGHIVRFVELSQLKVGRATSQGDHVCPMGSGTRGHEMGCYQGHVFTVMCLGRETWARSVDWYGNVTWYMTWTTG